jgi:hypothetical protein
MSPTFAAGLARAEPSQSGLITPDGRQWLPLLSEKLNRPLSARLCVLGWLASIGLFVALVGCLGGPSSLDSQESIYGTWAVAHGEIGCAYPSVVQAGDPSVAPLYPILSSGIAAVARIGSRVPFPSAATLGPGCWKGLAAMNQWYLDSHALNPTQWIGCVAWLALMVGVIVWLRASGRGRCGWEPVTLLFVAGLLPVWMCVQSVFHPQDLLALGLALAAMACARRQRWLTAGILLALAVLSQQFAILVAVPLFVLAPRAKRFPLTCAALLTGTIFVLPLTVLTSGRVLRSIALGTGDNPSEGGTVLWETHANGVAGVLLYRVAPIAISVLLSWWVVRRLGPRALDPVPFMSLVAVSLGLRLVFEVNLIAYYFMALTVTLVLLEATRGSIRRTVVAWLVALTLVICRISWMPFGRTRLGPYFQHDLVPLVVGSAVVLAIVVQLLRRGDRRNLWPWAAVAAVDLFFVLPGGGQFSAGQVIWFWQIVLVVPGLLLAAQPLRSSIKLLDSTRSHDVERAPSPTG